ncbi:Nucleotidyltransferase domain-containing protein, partial [Dysosmobacter welbionis]
PADAGVEPVRAAPVPSCGTAPQRQCRGAGAPDPPPAGGAGGRHSGGWLCHRSDGRGPLYRPGLFLPGGGAGDGRHLLPVHRRVHRPAEAPAEQPPVLLP